jgi:hypothetical protein
MYTKQALRTSDNQCLSDLLQTAMNPILLHPTYERLEIEVMKLLINSQKIGPRLSLRTACAKASLNYSIRKANLYLSKVQVDLIRSYTDMNNKQDKEKLKNKKVIAST